MNLTEQLNALMPTELVGSVARTVGMTVSAAGFPAPLGAVAEVERQAGGPMLAEVIGFCDDLTLLYPLCELSGVRHGNRVRLVRTARWLRVGQELLGRVIDAEGRAIDGKPQPNWQSVLYSIALRPSTTVRLQVRRDGETRDLVAQSGVTSDRIGTIGIGPTVRIQEVRPGTPAEQAGLKVGDAILKVGDKYIAHADDVSPAVQATEGREIPVQISRAAQTMTFPMVPARQDGAYRIGITVGGGDIIPRKFGPAGAFVAACRWSWERTQQIGEVLGRLLTARLSPKTVAGPLGIAQESGKAARSGPVAFFLFLAFISLNVGLLNLFPLPPLDGGHLAILAGESVIRRDFSATVKAWILNAGAVAILLLVALVLYSDFSKISLLKKFLP